MILRAKDGVRGKLIDLDTGREIPHPIWFNTDDGTFEAYRVDGLGNILKDAAGNYLIYWAKGRLKFIPRGSKEVAIPKPTHPIHPRLPKLERPKRRRNERLGALAFDQLCETCGNPAEYAVSDEIELPPEFKNGRWYSKAKTVQSWYWCAKHYKPPRLLDHKGEEIQKFDEAGGVRPQWHS